MDLKIECASSLRKMQQRIVSAFEKLDGGQRFRSDPWERLDGGYGGGGVSCIISDGAVFERAGINFSEVHGELPADMAEKLIGTDKVQPFFASGVSIVIHPRSPHVPTVHFNVRYLEVANYKWFGGGTDLTPYYLVDEDALHFHTVLRKHCEQFSPEFYPKFKHWCDQYFYLPHRKEARGIGGIFFDYLGKDEPEKLGSFLPFVIGLGDTFIDAYAPIVERRKSQSWSAAERAFQLLRRGRYVEFNLIYDRGTLFGLKTGGRTESILMSLPPEVTWKYDAQIPVDSREARLLSVLREPRDWISL